MTDVPRKPVLVSALTVPERVNIIADLMREGLWQRGKSAQEWADTWGLNKNTVEHNAAEAWKRVCAEADDPEKMRPEIAGILRSNLSRADKVMNFRAIASLAETYTKVIGARAPERHEHAVVIAQFDSLDKKGKLEWIQKRIDKLQEAKQALLEESSE